jgi:hypothetical protein
MWAATAAAYGVALGALVCYVSFVIGWRLSGTSRLFVRWSAFIASIVLTLTIVFHALTALHLFTRAGALIAFGAAAVGCSLGHGPRISIWWRRERLVLRRLARLLRRSSHRPVILFVLLLLSLVSLRTLILPPMGWDALTYHALKAATWVQEGSVVGPNGPGPWAYYPLFPGGGEVFLAWAMLPLHSDTLAPLVDIVEWLAIGFAAFALCRTFRVREPFSSTAAAFVLALPMIRLLVGAGYIDLCSLATLFVGMALGFGARPDRPGLFVLAAAALGASAATRIQMIPLTTIVVVAVAVRAVGRDRAASAWRVGAIVAAYVVCLAPWLLRNIVATGAPLSPFPIHIGPLALGRSTPELEWYMRRSADELAHARSYSEVFWVLFGSPFGSPALGTETLGILSLVPIVAAILATPSFIRRVPLAGMTILAVAGACLAMYLSPSFWIVRHLWTASTSRFLLPFQTLAVIVSVTWCRRGSRAAVVYRHALLLILIVHLARYALTGATSSSIDAMLALLWTVAGIATVSLIAARIWAPARLPAMIAGLVLGITSLQGIRATYRNDLFRREFLLFPFDREWIAALPAVDDPAMRHRIAVTGGPQQNLDNWLAYPFVGRELQNALLYMPVSREGAVYPVGDAFQRDLRAAASFDAWQHRLHEQRVSHVLSFTPPSIELAWMEERPHDFQRLSGSRGEWGLFAVR